MEYRKPDQAPVTKPKRVVRRDTQREKVNREQESERQKSKGGGNELSQLGVTQGQNGEQGNTADPRNAQPLGETRENH